jgi:hypothetical protein
MACAACGFVLDDSFHLAAECKFLFNSICLKSQPFCDGFVWGKLTVENRLLPKPLYLSKQNTQHLELHYLDATENKNANR